MNNILFSHKIHTELYLNRTRPILKKMIDNGLIDDFINLVNKTLTIETFCKNRKLLPEFFTEYDYNDIYISNSLLLKIKENPNNIHISSDNDIDLITKIMMKKYLLENIELNEHKVNIQVKIENTNEYIKVVSYNNIDKNTKNPKLKHPSGCVNKGEQLIDAAKRELKEELGLIINDDRFNQINKNTFSIILTINEYNEYVKIINDLYIDPEITMIIKQ